MFETPSLFYFDDAHFLVHPINRSVLRHCGAATRKQKASVLKFVCFSIDYR